MAKDKRPLAKRPMPSHELAPHQVIPLLLKYGGNVSKVADALGCDRHSIHAMVSRCPEVAQARQQARERLVDELEDTAADIAINDRNPKMIEFLLKTIGKSRGYSFIDTDNTLSFALHQAFNFVKDRQSAASNAVIDVTPQP